MSDEYLRSLRRAQEGRTAAEIRQRMRERSGRELLRYSAGAAGCAVMAVLFMAVLSTVGGLQQEEWPWEMNRAGEVRR
jgi:hypothetical protein